MTMKTSVAALFAAALVLGACAKEPEPVYLQPTFDKAGNASCAAGYMLATTENGATVCAPI
jgi:PBP1b-binding outer membrane lipoprotein LpoB